MHILQILISLLSLRPVKLKPSLCLIKHDARKTFRRSDGITDAMDGVDERLLEINSLVFVYFFIYEPLNYYSRHEHKAAHMAQLNTETLSSL